MKPFDLEKALAGEPVVTRDGRTVDKIVVFEKIGAMTALIQEGRDILINYYNLEGKINDSENIFDLFMKSEDDKTRYFCVYKTLSGEYLTSPLFDSRDVMIYWVRARSNSEIIKEFEFKIDA